MVAGLGRTTRCFVSFAVTLALVTVGAVASLTPQRASAATTYNWTGDGDGISWGQEENWSPPGIPADGDSVVIEKTVEIRGVQTVSLVALSVTGDRPPPDLGPILVGPTSTITTEVLNWSEGRIATNLVVRSAALLLAARPAGLRLENGYTPVGVPPVSLTTLGNATQAGTLWLNNGASRVINEGTWTAAGDATIAGSHCCVNPGTFTNNGTLIVGGNLTIDQAMFRARPQSRVNGVGTVRIVNGTPELAGPWTLGGNATLSLFGTSGGTALTTVQGTTTIGSGATIQQQGFASIRGTGVFAGSGAYQWLGGRILGNLTLGASLSTVISGNTLHELTRSAGAGVLTVEGKVTQHDQASLRMNGNIFNKGTWEVPAGAQVSIAAGSLGTVPFKFSNEGTIKVGTGGNLSLSLLGYSNPVGKGVITGGGIVGLLGGIHQLRDGGTIRGPGTELDVSGRADITATGTLKLDNGELVLSDRSVLRGKFTIGGTGRTVWNSANDPRRADDRPRRRGDDGAGAGAGDARCHQRKRHPAHQRLGPSRQPHVPVPPGGRRPDREWRDLDDGAGDLPRQRVL